MPSTLQARQLVRSQPYRTQITRGATLGNGLTVTHLYDVSLVVCDRNQLTAVGASGLPSVGPYLDAMLFADQAGSLDVLFTVDQNLGTHSILPGGTPLVLTANTPLLITHLPLCCRYVTLTYLNSSGVLANYEFGSYVGSQ